MEIVVDIGNTRTKVALFNEDKLIEFFSFSNLPSEEVLSTISSFRPDKGIISTVSNDKNVWINFFPDVDWVNFSSATALPFKNRYDTPQTLGLDRIALAAAAHSEFSGKNVLIIDAGTCITFDFINKEGEYLGGAISPGLHMRMKALNYFTARLPLAELVNNTPLTGRNTTECIQSGVINGIVFEINGSISTYKAQFHELEVVLTGGDTFMLAPLIKNSIFAHPNFLLEGLHAILRYNSF
jgi:type III pantothenate kinase